MLVSLEDALGTGSSVPSPDFQPAPHSRRYKTMRHFNLLAQTDRQTAHIYQPPPDQLLPPNHRAVLSVGSCPLLSEIKKMLWVWCDFLERCSDFMDKYEMSPGLGHHSEEVSHEKQAFIFPIYLHQIYHDLFPPCAKAESWTQCEEQWIHGGKQIFSALRSVRSSG